MFLAKSTRILKMFLTKSTRILKMFGPKHKFSQADVAWLNCALCIVH